MASAISLLGLFVGLVAAETCYQLDGQKYSKIRPDDGDWVACNPGAEVSACCSEKDYCMGNGLCLDAASNNFFSIQGCTDSSWGKPCITAQACKDSMQNNYSFIWACGQHTDVDFNYCCGKSADCCQNSSTYIIIPGATAISRPGATSTSTSVSSQTPPAGSTTSNPGTTSPASSSDGKTLAIAIGVGAGVGVPLIAALVFFGWQLRKSRKEAQRPVSMVSVPYTASSVAPFTPKVPAPSPTPQGPDYYYQPVNHSSNSYQRVSHAGSSYQPHPYGSPELASQEVPRPPLTELNELQ
ncbi:hypothetical protein GQ53DRAFT_753786 [Thozetella sp. PMI_491]|nr:hypothetical protein GQ53DRAFT_753786 [Thozetella sp. PMI_491]